MGRPKACVLNFAGNRTLSLLGATFQQAAQKRSVVVRSPTTTSSDHSALAANLRLVHHRFLVGVERYCFWTVELNSEILWNFHRAE